MLDVLLYFVLFLSRVNCTLIGSGSGQRDIASTSFKFYGEKNVYLNLTGAPVVVPELSDSKKLCRGHFDKELTSKGYAGQVVVFVQENCQQCDSWVSLYSKLSELKALAVLVSTSDKFPGQYMFSHDGSRGLSTRNHPMPFVHISAEDVSVVVDALVAGDTVILESTPNPWEKIYTSVFWIMILRVIPAFMSFMTAVVAVKHLIRRDGNHRVSWLFSKSLSGDITVLEAVLMLEAASMSVLSVVYGLGFFYTGDAFSTKTLIAMMPTLTGVGFFTSILLMLQLQVLHGRVNVINNAGVNKSLKDYGQMKVACIAIATLGFEFIYMMLPAYFSFEYLCYGMIAIMVLYPLAQLGVAASFARAFVVLVWSRRRHIRRRQPVFNFITGLAMSGMCMILHSISIAVLIGVWNARPSSFCGAVALHSFTRASVSMAQVFSVCTVPFHHDAQLECVELEINSQTAKQRSSSAPESPKIVCSKFGEARHTRIRQKFTDFEVAAITFEANGHTAHVSTACGSTEGRFIGFLQTTLQGVNTTWLETLKTLPLYSQFKITQLRLNNTYFDVRVHMPYEGEILVCIQETPAIVSTLKDYIAMIKHDPGLITLQWDETKETTNSEEDGSGSEVETEEDGSDDSNCLSTMSSDMQLYHQPVIIVRSKPEGDGVDSEVEMQEETVSSCNGSTYDPSTIPSSFKAGGVDTGHHSHIFTPRRPLSSTPEQSSAPEMICRG